MVTFEPLHRFGTAPHPLALGTPLRRLDAGMRKPVLFQLDGPDGPASWVVKAPHNERQRESGLLFEVIGAELAAWMGIATPAIGLVRFGNDPLATDDTDVGAAARSIYEGSAGRTGFCSYYLAAAPAVREGDLDDLRSVPTAMREDAIRVLSLDVLLRHHDRTPQNPNLLTREDRLVAIDHGLAFFRLGVVDESGLAAEADDAGDATALARHVAARVAGKESDSPVWAEAIDRVLALDDTTVRAMLDRAPEVFDRAPDWRSLGMKREIERFLRNRRSAFAEILENVRACLPR